jgi:endonuclease/exonuclease/phosphatase family metal-dependent hydrolase
MTPTPSTADSHPPTDTYLRIVSWNLWDYGTSPQRQHDQLRFLREVAPHVLLVQEIRTSRPDDTDLVAVFATLTDALNMCGKPVAAPRSRCHLGILWHPGIGLLDWFAKPYSLWHGLGIAVLDIGSPWPLHVAATHLSPWDPEQRLADVRTVAALLEKYRALVGADWNCLGDDPWYDPEPDWSALPIERQLHHVRWSDDPNQPPKGDRRPTQYLTRAGLTDAAPHLDIPWQATAGHIGIDIPRRIDAFRVSPTALPALVGYEVLDSPTTRRLSAHLPIQLTIDPAVLT